MSVTTTRPLRVILRDQSKLHANKTSSGLHAFLIRIPYAEVPFSFQIENLDSDYHFLDASSLDFEAEIQPFGDTIPLFARNTASYPGQAGGVLIGPSLAGIKNNLSKIKIVFNSDENSLNTPERKLYRSKNFSFGVQDKLPAEESLRKIESRLDIVPLQNVDLEDRSIYVQVLDDGLFIEACHPWPHLLRKVASEASGIPQRSIVVKAGVSFQLKPQRLMQGLVPTAIASLMARVYSESLTLHWTAQDNIKYAYSQVQASFRIQSSHQADGTLCGLKTHISVDLGAEALAPDEVLAQLALSCVSVYRAVPADIRIDLWISSDPPRNTGTSAGEHIGQIAMEHHWDMVARTLNINPVSWRMENLRLIQQGAQGILYDDSVHHAQTVLSRILNLSDFHRRQATYQVQNSYARNSNEQERRQPLDPSYPGIGIALGYQAGNLVTMETNTDVSVRFQLESDGHLLVTVPFEPGNMSIISAWTRLISQELGISARNIAVVPLDTASQPDPGPMTDGRQYSIVSPLLAEACQELKKRLAAGETTSTIELHRKQADKPFWEPGRIGSKPFAQRTWGACVLDINLERATGSIRVKRVWFCAHMGTFLPESRAISILENGIRESLRASLGGEQGAVDIECEIKILLLPASQDHHEEKETIDNLSQIRGVDALPPALVPAAFLNALNQALSQSPTIFPPPHSSYLEEI